MTQKQADKFMNGMFEEFVSRVQNAKTDDEAIRFTDEAHKLYITLSTANAFESAGNDGGTFGS